MIQRIQTLFLGLAAAGLLSLFKLPLARSSQSFGDIYNNGTLDLQDHMGLLGLVILGGIMAIATIFLYNNRKLQVSLSFLIAILSLILVTFSFWLFNGTVPEDTKITTHLDVGFYLPLVALFFAFLATIFIKKDDKLVKSMDRLR